MADIMINRRNKCTVFEIIVGCFIFVFLNVQICAATIDPLKLQEELAEQRKFNEMRKKSAAQGVQFISAYEALAKFNAGKLFLLDVNERSVYQVQRIVGAVNCDNVQKARFKIPKHVEIGVYCRWPGEYLSAGAALHLMKKGLTNVKVILGGHNEMVKVGFTWWRGGDIIKNGKVLYRVRGR